MHLPKKLATHFPPDWQRFLLRWLGISLGLHLLAAWFSAGFYHADEHFQILEFMNYRLGGTPIGELPLEFREQMRPWIPAFFFLGITKVVVFFGVKSPLLWAFFYRLMSALIGWVSVIGLALVSTLWIEDGVWKKWAVILLATAWYLPALHARPSSENLGGSLFLISLCAWILALETEAFKSRKGFPLSVLLGALFGLAFEFRYQIGVMIFGASLWLIVIARIRAREILGMALGFLGIFALGTYADQIGYGHFTFSPWNYVHYNLILNHVSDEDVSPLWDFFRRAFTESWPLLGFLLLCSFPVAWFRNPKNALTWSLAPLFIVHELIGHKELRFLFPLAGAGPLVWILAFYSTKTKRLGWSEFAKIRFLKGASLFLLILNGSALIFTTLLPAWMPVRFYAHIYALSEKTPELALYYLFENPYTVNGSHMYFYRPKNLRLSEVKGFPGLDEKLRENHSPVYVFYNHAEFPTEGAPLRAPCALQFSSIPQFLTASSITHIFEHMTNWSLYLCRGKTS